MKKILRQTLALMMATIMAIPAVLVMPFSASAAEETITPSKYVLVTSSTSGDRGDGDDGCIVNDGSADNMSAMLWQYDLSGIKRGYEVTSASFAFEVWSINVKEIADQQLDVWYFNPETYSAYSGYSNGSRVTDTSLGYGDEGPASYRAAFGVEDDYYIGSRAHSYTEEPTSISFSNDALVGALNKAVDEGWGSIVFVIMHNKTASVRWSDIWTGIKDGRQPSLTYSTVKIDDKQYVEDRIASYNGENIVAKSSGIKFSNGGNSYTENVLYTANGNFDSNYFEGVLNGNNKLGFNIYPASSRAVYLYTSDDSVIGYPLVAKVQKSQAAATTVHWGVNYLAVDNANNWRLSDDWHVCSNDRSWDDLLDSQSDKAYGVNKINYDVEQKTHYNENIQVGSWSSHPEGHFTGDSPKTLSNTIRYDNSAINFGDAYYYSIPAVPTFKASADGCGHWIGSQAAWNDIEVWNGITIDGKQSIDLKVLNAKPLKDLASSDALKNDFNAVSENEWMYSDESLAAYYKYVADIMRFDANSYDYSSDSGLQEAADDIKDLVDNYKLPTKKTFTVNFKTADGTSVIEERTVTAGDPLGTLPENSTPTHIEETNTHNAYIWDGVTAEDIIREDTDYTEIATTENCVFEDSHTASTEALNGYTTYTCECGNSYIEYDAQDWRNYDNAIAAYNERLSSADYATKYTLSSRTDYENSVEAARLDASDETLSPTVIENAALEITGYESVLDEVADLSVLVNAYEKANGFLLELDSKAAQYEQNSVQNLVDAVSDEDVAKYLNAEDKTVFGQADEAKANELAQAINNAYDSLVTASGSTDVSAYTSATEAVNNLDGDIYNSTNSIASAVRIANILVKSSTINYTDTTDSENTSAIKVLSGDATQQNIDDATRTLLDSLYVSVKSYTITTDGEVAEVSFQNGTSSGDVSPYIATYGSTAIARSDNNETAWYMDFSSEATTRGKQYQSFGDSFSTKVFGNMNIYAETRTESAPNMVRISRSYSNNLEKTPVQLITFVSDSYTLPEAPAFANYSFSGYDINGEIKSANDVIAVTGDVDIKALYTFSGSADCAVNAAALENGTGFNDSVAYNTKIELKGGDNAYAWVEEVSAGKFRPFAIGSDITFFASESINLTAVTEEEFSAYNFTLPAVNMRRAGVLTSSAKVTFNGQIVDPNSKVREYGVVVAVAKNGAVLDEDDLAVEKAGNYENYDIIRAKSTQKVGANQFAIGITGLAGKDFIYKGYVIYEKTNGEFITVYSE
ncbi:MAG: hypothetical protein IJR70_03015 [Eubacterium sp.]|nr:hypothetical protein [Eubacterium sp.]